MANQRPARPSASPPRRLGPPQMAFVRAWAEGLDLVAAWNRFLYVDGAGDTRRARSELQRLLDQLRSLARAQGRPEVAALLRRDPEAMPERGPRVPTLEEFAAQQPPDYYSEAELVALHQAEYGRADSRSTARRRQRLRERLIGAVLWLERLEARAPQPGDATLAWLDARVAQRLAVVGIRTLGELGFWIRTKGFHWHRAVPRLGPEGAARLVRWLAEHQASLGALPSPALMPPSRLDKAVLTPTPRAGIVPLERFRPPADRDGTRGSNRAPQAHCRITARDDLQAIQAWLQLREPGSHTWRAYRKEAERWLLWAVMVRRKALSALDDGDCQAYADFLAAPGPEWTGPRGAQRWSEAWRPFEGPLSAASRGSAITVVRGLSEWLVRQRYLQTNPWHGVAAAPATPAATAVTAVTATPAASEPPPLRALSPQQWALVQRWLADELAQAPSPALHRLRFLLDFTAMTGLRLGELAAARMGWLRRHAIDEGLPGAPDDAPDGAIGWSIHVPGPRGRSREVPLPDAALQALRAGLAARGLDVRGLDGPGLEVEARALPPETPLVARLDREAPLAAARIYDILVAGFERCAARVWAIDRQAAERIREASTHWLRHTYGAHLAAHGVPQDVLQANLGHQSAASAAVYLRTGRARGHRAVQEAFKTP